MNNYKLAFTILLFVLFVTGAFFLFSISKQGDISNHIKVTYQATGTDYRTLIEIHNQKLNSKKDILRLLNREATKYDTIRLKRTVLHFQSDKLIRIEDAWPQIK
ncbi:hypothetical protein EMN47_02940 [Prolixibacteraceae bacterium JC049]|nr:hypothetical protein [Prolixibacteraceae bacterium JC049]